MNTGKTLTLTSFLENTGAQLSFYDVGRRIEVIDRYKFEQFENTATSYPYPMQGKAWIALVQQRPQDLSEPLIWFLRFDLDEQSKLIQATRDYFIHRFIELAKEKPKNADLSKALEDNPFTFKPREDKLANLHALLGRTLERPPSQFFTHACDYFSGTAGWDQWQFVGFQGIAELAARIDQRSTEEQLTKALPQLPDEPLSALCQCLENHPLPNPLAAAVAKRIDTALDANEPPVLIANLLRALAKADESLRTNALQRVLEHPSASDPEILAAIGGRLWETLHTPWVARAYLQTLAEQAVDQTIFNHCLSDLLRLPNLQQPLLEQLRDPNRTPEVAAAFGRMLNG